MVNHSNRKQLNRGSVALGVLVASACYLVLAMRKPHEWGLPLWSGLALALVPLLCGAIIGRGMGGDFTRAKRFRTAFYVSGLMMAIYSGISLMIVRSGIDSSASASAVAVVGLFVSAVYAVIAGTIAGIASALIVRHEKGHKR